MKKFFIALVVLIVILAVMVALAVLNLNYFINQNKDYLLTQVEESLGRKVAVGNVETGFSDGIGIRMTDFAVSDDRDYSAGDFISAKDIQVNVAFFPLLSKKIVVTKLILNEPEITVIRNKNGEFNFSTLANGDKSEKSGDEEGRSEEDQIGQIPVAASNIAINNGRVTYIDEENGRELEAGKIELGIQDLGFEKEIGVKLKAAVLAKDQNVLLDASIGPLTPGMEFGDTELKGDARVTDLNVSTLKRSLPMLKEQIPQGLDFSGPIEAKFKFSGKAPSISLSDIDAAASIFGASKPNFKLTGSAGPIGESAESFKINVEFDLTNANLNKLRKLSYIKDSIPNSLSSHGDISLRGKVSGTPDNLKLRGIVVDATATRLAVIGKFLKPSGTPLLITTGADIGSDKINLSETEMKLSSLLLLLSGQINQGTTTLLNLSLSSNNINLSDMKDIFPALKKYGVSGQLQLMPTKVTGESGKGQTPDIRGALDVKNLSVKPPDFKQPIKDINTKVEFTGNSASVKDMTLRMGKSQLRLSTAVTSFSPLRLSYDVSSPELNLSDLKKEPRESKKPDVLKDLKSKGSLRMSNSIVTFSGNVSSSKAVLSDFELTDLKSNLSLTGDKAKVNSFSTKAYNGTISGKASYAMGATPEFALISTVKGIDLKTFLTSRNPKGEQNIVGKANLDINVFGSGSEWDKIKPALKGTAKAEIVNGAVLDINLAEEVLKGITGLPGLTVFISPRVRERYPQVFSTRDTEFEEFKASFILEKGKMRTSDLRITSSDYRVAGRGWIDFDSRVDMKSLLTLSKELSEDLEEDVQELKYISSDEGLIEIPFAITGKLPDAKPKPDMGHLTTLVERATIRKGKEELKKQVLDKLLSESEKENAQDAQAEEATGEKTQNTETKKKKKKKRLDEKILDELGDLF